MTARKRTAKNPDLAALAKAVVDARLYFLGDWLDFADANPPLRAPESWSKWEALVATARVQVEAKLTAPTYKAFRDGLGSQNPEYDDFVGDTEAAHAQAGFLVGLELGRRLGGGR